MYKYLRNIMGLVKRVKKIVFNSNFCFHFKFLPINGTEKFICVHGFAPVISTGSYGIFEHVYLLRDFTFSFIQVLSLSRRS